VARHGGFAVSATVGEDLANQTLWAAVGDLGLLSDKQAFPLPTTVPIFGGQVVHLSGIAIFERRPTLHFTANAGNTVGLTASAVAYASANLDPGTPVSFDETWRFRITGDASVGIDVEVANDGVYLRWDPGSTTFNVLQVVPLEGPALPTWLVAAINSPGVRAALTAAVRARGPVRISPKLLDRHLEHIQPANFPKTNTSLFQWFKIEADVSRVILRVNQGSVSVGVDFAGLSAGDPTALVDLISDVGADPVYRWPVFDNTFPNERPTVVGVGAKPGRGDVAVLFNGDVLAAIAGRVSAQVTGTHIDPAVTLKSISTSPVHFTKPLRGPETGLAVGFTVTHKDAGDIAGRAILQPYLLYDGEPGPTPFPARWLLYIGLVEIDVPWWVDIAVIVAGLVLAVTFPFLTPLLAVGVVAVLDGVLPGLISNVEAKSERALQQGVVLASAVTDTTLPTAKAQPAWLDVERIAVSMDGLDAVISLVAWSVRGAGSAVEAPARVDVGFDAGSPGPYSVSVSLIDDLQPLAQDAGVRLIVRRSSDGVELARSEGPFLQHRQLFLDHLDPDVYFVDAFDVEVRVWSNAASMAGLLFSMDRTVQVGDNLDRHHPYVTWGQHWAHFQNVGTGGKWWHRRAVPTLHRTAASARCRSLRQRAERAEMLVRGPGFDYRDILPFDPSTLKNQRRAVCDFCFFGGPDKAEPFSLDDWFRRT
jgi:hypothetical protein